MIFAAYQATRGLIHNFIRLGLRMRLQIFFTKGLPNESHWKHTNALLKKLPEHVIASSEAAESSPNVNMPEEEKHDGVVFFEGSPDGNDETDTSPYRPIGY